MPFSSPEFREHCQGVVAELQASWIELLGSLGLADERPLHLAGHLALSSTLSWHVSRAVQASSPAEAVQWVPRSQGRERLLQACKRKGAPESVLDRARLAERGFQEMVDTHAGDQETLSAMLLGDGLPDDSKQLERLRKQAFRANSAYCGVQARARLATMIHAPSEREGFVTVACIGGLLDFRRLNPHASWPASYLRGKYKLNEDGSISGTQRPPQLFDEFCTISPSSLRARQEPDGVSYWLENERVGLSGAGSYVIRYVAELGLDPRGTESYVDLKTPVESLVFTLLFHQDLRPKTVKPYVYNRMQGSLVRPLHEHEEHHLPFRPKFEQFEQATQGSTTPVIPRHREMVRLTSEWMGWKIHEFSGCRMTMRYPPIPTLPGVHWTI